MRPIATIKKLSRNINQSGTSYVGNVVLYFDPIHNATTNRITGWIGGTDVDSQIKLRFESLESAIEYTKANNIEYKIIA